VSQVAPVGEPLGYQNCPAYKEGKRGCKALR